MNEITTSLDAIETGSFIVRHSSWTTLLFIVIGAAILFVIWKYNQLIKLKNFIKNALSDIAVQIKLRFDLVENLVNTVKGYQIHEQDTLTKIAEARSNFSNAKTENEKISADEKMGSVLKTLFAVAENYPDLKANQNFVQLQIELSDIENKIAAARRFFNSSVKDYNTSIEVFPTNLIAKAFGFKHFDFFEVSESEKTAPKVTF